MKTKIRFWIPAIMLALSSLFLVTNCEKEDDPKIMYGSVNDIDGNTYKTVIIGNQTWLTENLKVTKYNDGTIIPNVSDDSLWCETNTSAVCDYNNTASNSENYGKLYNWYAVNTGKLCPTGWHVPSDAEWTTLENYLIANGYNYDGTTTRNKIAKAMGSIINWEYSSRTGAVGNTDFSDKRNATGFNGYPSGLRLPNTGDFDEGGFSGNWWSSTEYNLKSAYGRDMDYAENYIRRDNGRKNYGFSVRCVKD